MNSKQLQIEFKDVYKKFYHENQIVISTPFVMNRAGDIHSKYSGLSIKQKIPLRLYFGLKKIDTPSFEFDNIIYFDTNVSSFVDTTCSNYLPYGSQIIKYLNSEYKHLLEGQKGYKIQILSETSRGVGVGFNPLFTLMCSVVVNYLTNRGSNREKSFCSDLYKTINADSIFRKIILDSIEFDYLISPYPSITTKICSLAYGDYPIVGFREDGSCNKPSNDRTLFAYRYNELWSELPDSFYVPFDFSLVYSGKPVIGEQLIASDKTYSDWHERDHNELIEIFTSRLKQHSKNCQPVFYKNFIQASPEIITEIYGHTMGAISIEVMQTMAKVLGVGFNDRIYQNFIRSLNKVRYGNMIIRKSSKTLIDFLTAIVDSFGSKKDTVAVTPNDTIAMGGALTVVCPLESCRGVVDETISTLKKVYFGAAVVYSNWKDGICGEGFKVEQDLEVKIFSNHLQNAHYALCRANGDTIIGSLDDVKKELSSGLFLDLIVNKILINGERITSSDILSQQTTIELLICGQENNWEPISNSVLSISSFAKNKSELVSKIINPFKKLIFTRMDTEIDILCHGDSSDYTISFELNGLEIGSINKISHFS